MQEKTILPSEQLVETYKNVIDTFGGPQRMAEQFNWSISTIYRWLAGNTMGLTYAILINSRKPTVTIEQLVGYELACNPVYLKVLSHFGSQTEAASALGLAQVTVRSWVVGESQISLEKAQILETVTKGKFHPSDFPHLNGTFTA